MSLEGQLLDILPGMAPPPGETSNFVDPSHPLQKYNVITLAVCMTVSTLFVAMRIYTNARIIRPLNWEDYTCVIAWLGLVAFAALNIPLRANGDGVHQWNVPLSHLIRWAQYVNILEIMLCIVTLFTRASIILLYERMFAPNHISRLYIITQFMFYFNIATTIVLMFIFIFECVPRPRLWDPTIPGHCLDPFAIYYSSGILNISIDSVLFILPQYSIWNMQMPWEKKAKVSAAFAVAIFAPVASIFRLVASIQNGKSPDMTYSTYTIGLWTAAEITTGIVCSCFPAFSAFAQKTVPHISSKLSSFRSTSGTTGVSPSSATSSQNPKPADDIESQCEGSHHELGSITYHEGLLKERTLSAEQVSAHGGTWKTMSLESAKDLSGAGARGMSRGV